MIDDDAKPQKAADRHAAVEPKKARGSAQDLIARYKSGTGKSDRLKRHDYVSNGLSRIRPDNLFPNLASGNPFANDWEFLRRTVPHTWYVDSRFPRMGYLSRDEASILYNTALQFKGKRALEIGCWRGWSTAHLLKAGVILDVVDIVLEDRETRKELEGIAAGLKATKRVIFNPGSSEATIANVANQNDEKWSLIFIDGDHETPAPAQDAELCIQFAADDALIVFHDLASPAVSAGLEVLQDLGWNTRVYQTMQVMGVAWRGNVKPVDHVPDPSVDWEPLDHLARFQLIHESNKEFQERAVHNLTKFSDQSLIIKNFTSSIRNLSLSFNELDKSHASSEANLAETCQLQEVEKQARAVAEQELANVQQLHTNIQQLHTNIQQEHANLQQDHTAVKQDLADVIELRLAEQNELERLERIRPKWKKLLLRWLT